MSTLRHAVPGSQTGPAPADTLVLQRILPAEPVSVPVARRLATSALTRYGLNNAVGDCVLVVAELASNAVRESHHSSRPQILLRIYRGPRCIVIQVGDRNPLPPPRAPGILASHREHGRGLLIVQALCAHMAWCSEDGWKIVWVVMPVPAAKPQRASRWRWGRAA